MGVPAARRRVAYQPLESRLALGRRPNGRSKKHQEEKSFLYHHFQSRLIIVTLLHSSHSCPPSHGSFHLTPLTHNCLAPWLMLPLVIRALAAHLASPVLHCAVLCCAEDSCILAAFILPAICPPDVYMCEGGGDGGKGGPLLHTSLHLNAESDGYA